MRDRSDRTRFRQEARFYFPVDLAEELDLILEEVDALSISALTKKQIFDLVNRIREDYCG